MPCLFLLVLANIDTAFLFILFLQYLIEYLAQRIIMAFLPAIKVCQKSYDIIFFFLTIFTLWQCLLFWKVLIGILPKPKYMKVNEYVFFILENMTTKITLFIKLFICTIILFIGINDKYYIVLVVTVLFFLECYKYKNILVNKQSDK